MTLTREKVLAMVAGREMDEAIGKAFDLKPSIQTRQESILIIKDRIFKRYSTDISAAWEVVEKIAKSGSGVELYVNRVTNTVTIGQITVHSDDSMPLAICRVALLTTIGEGT